MDAWAHTDTAFPRFGSLAIQSKLPVKPKGSGGAMKASPEIDPLDLAREICDEERRVKDRQPERNDAIRRAIARGDSERKVAKELGFSQTRINEIVNE